MEKIFWPNGKFMEVDERSPSRTEIGRKVSWQHVKLTKVDGRSHGHMEP